MYFVWFNNSKNKIFNTHKYHSLIYLILWRYLACWISCTWNTFMHVWSKMFTVCWIKTVSWNCICDTNQALGIPFFSPLYCMYTLTKKELLALFQLIHSQELRASYEILCMHLASKKTINLSHSFLLVIESAHNIDRIQTFKEK